MGERIQICDCIGMLMMNGHLPKESPETISNARELLSHIPNGVDLLMETKDRTSISHGIFHRKLRKLLQTNRKQFRRTEELLPKIGNLTDELLLAFPDRTTRISRAPGSRNETPLSELFYEHIDMFTFGHERREKIGRKAAGAMGEKQAEFYAFFRIKMAYGSQ